MSSAKNRCILVIDDEIDLCHIVQITLERLKGWRILTAQSVQAGLVKAQTEQPDVILLDLSLDDDGLNLLKTLKANQTTQSILVILFTATDIDSSPDLNPSDIAGVILKPFNVFKLADQITEQLGW
jgi:DNA-binding response OmpR family regulator